MGSCASVPNTAPTANDRRSDTTAADSSSGGSSTLAPRRKKNSTAAAAASRALPQAQPKLPSDYPSLSSGSLSNRPAVSEKYKPRAPMPTDKGDRTDTTAEEISPVNPLTLPIIAAAATAAAAGMERTHSGLFSSSSTASRGSTRTFPSADFGPFLTRCDSGDMMNDSVTDLHGGGGNSGWGPTGEADSGGDRSKQMLTFYNDFKWRYGGRSAKDAAKLNARRPTAMELLKRRERGESGQQQQQRQQKLSLALSTVGSLNGAQGGEGGGSTVVDRQQALRDPVDPDIYVAELHRYCREKKKGGKLIVDQEGEMRRLYHTQGWHKLRTKGRASSSSSSSSSPRNGVRRSGSGSSSSSNRRGGSNSGSERLRRSSAGGSAGGSRRPSRRSIGTIGLARTGGGGDFYSAAYTQDGDAGAVAHSSGGSAVGAVGAGWGRPLPLQPSQRSTPKPPILNTRSSFSRDDLAPSDSLVSPETPPRVMTPTPSAQRRCVSFVIGTEEYHIPKREAG